MCACRGLARESNSTCPFPRYIKTLPLTLRETIDTLMAQQWGGN